MDGTDTTVPVNSMERGKMRLEADKKQRIDYFDTAKGILILLVILGHVLAYEESYLKSVIYTFHMPAFFLISGILATKGSSLRKPFAEYIMLKARSILVPYVVFEAISQLVENARGGFWMNFNGYVFTVVSACLKNDCANWANWFLVALFFGELLLYFYQRIPKLSLQVTLLLGAAILAVFIPDGTVGQTAFAFVFLAVGACFGQTLDYGDAYHLRVVISGLLVMLAAGLNGRISIEEGMIHNPLLFYIGGLAGTIFILQVSKDFLRKCKFLKYCGRNSLYIMGLHVPVIRSLGFLNDYIKQPFAKATVVLALVMTAVLAAVWLINRVKAVALLAAGKN